ncbi:hypothetical protein GCD22_00746 [Acidithiobacillus thiooxidans ATCC 19377]|uniref:Uncharacterized protein n=1 Tax=Acidithiobacillus thiooxidans ATCC 19377 TaxID=637390 RepID=A0A5P9XMJ0_ACITH|nr:hypothetical protein GCD22_00746 [Acidithiobacillus thiooxidans ATCC 19377]
MLCSTFPDPREEARLINQHAAAKANHGPGLLGIIATVEQQTTDSASSESGLLFGELADGQELRIVRYFLHLSILRVAGLFRRCAENREAPRINRNAPIKGLNI